MHVPYFMRKLKEKGLSLRLFSTSSIEKKNHCQVFLFYFIFFIKYYIY
jgi:hypothetical protein